MSAVGSTRVHGSFGSPFGAESFDDDEESATQLTP